MNLFVNRFKEQIQLSGKMQKEICQDLGISKQKLSNWKTGYTEPNLDDIIMLANYFDVSVDYLIGNDENYNSTKYNINFRDNNGTINNNFK